MTTTVNGSRMPTPTEALAFWTHQLTTEINSIRTLQAKLPAYPGKMTDARSVIADREAIVVEARRELAREDADLSMEVANDTTLTNDAKRKAALERLRRQMPSYQLQERRLMLAEGQLEQARSDLQRVVDEWRVLRACLEGSLAIANLLRSAQGPYDQVRL